MLVWHLINWRPFHLPQRNVPYDFLPPYSVHNNRDNNEVTVGSWNEYTYLGTNRMRGNKYYIESTTHLIEQRQYLGISNSTALHFSVYEAVGYENGEYTLVNSTVIENSGTGEGWYSSGVIDVLLEAGKHYAIVVFDINKSPSIVNKNFIYALSSKYIRLSNNFLKTLD